MIKWGILGCGDVAEIKSGPAFQKAKNSQLVGVMRRNTEKAKSFALRHNVPFWYDSVKELLGNQEINAIYVASPPAYHEEHTICALQAGKHVYLEKPMAVNTAACKHILKVADNSSAKLTIAHYRRALPAFIKVKALLDSHQIGAPRTVGLRVLQPKNSAMTAQQGLGWRINPEISGGGLFHDLAPHHLDLMVQYFGLPVKYSGFSSNQAKTSVADDTVSATMLFSSGVQFQGGWCFSVSANEHADECVIVGTQGSIRFSFFGEQVVLRNENGEQTFTFTNPENVQLPMIQRVTDYFLGEGENPCSGRDATEIIQLIDSITA